MRSSTQHLARIFRCATLAAPLAAVAIAPGTATASGHGGRAHARAAGASAHIRARPGGEHARTASRHHHRHRRRAGHSARHRGRGHDARRRGRHGHRRARHSLRASDRARLHYVSASGATLFEVGHATGTLPGSMHVHMKVSATFTGSFTIRTSEGTITGHGRATPHGSGTIESFAGTLTVTGGSGRYAHARGHAGLYGTFNRSNYALTIKTTGTLHY